MQKHKYHAYASATQTVAKTQQIVMLYDGVLRFMRQAREAIKERRIEDRYHLLTKASQVVNGLQSCLDFERGGDIARVLYSFYASVDGRIFSIHRTNSIETCDDIISDVKQMRDVWQEIDTTTATASENSSSSTQAVPVTTDSQQNITLSA